MRQGTLDRECPFYCRFVPLPRAHGRFRLWGGRFDYVLTIKRERRMAACTIQPSGEARSTLRRGRRWMKGMQSHEGGSSTVSITVLSVTPARTGRLFGIRIELPQIPRRRRLLAPGDHPARGGARALVPGGGRMISHRTYTLEKPGSKARFIASRGACLHPPCADGTVRDV